MGLLDFLSRRGSTASNADQGPLQARGYETAVAAIAPTRGHYPVSGNGPKVFEDWRGFVKTQSQSDLSNSSASGPNYSTSRTQPNTATSSRPASRTSTRSISRASNRSSLLLQPRSPLPNGKAPASPALGKTYGPYRIFKDDYDPSAAPRVLHTPEPFSRHGSVSSTQSSRARKSNAAHVDLLDAQSDFSPSDFHSRVRATGVRDYGEDVADRNIQENATLMSLSQMMPSPSTVPDVPRQPQPQTAIRGADWKRVSVIPEDANEEDDTNNGSAASPAVAVTGRSLVQNRRNSRQAADSARVLQNRRSFSEFSSSPANRRSKPPRPLSLHPAVSNFVYPAAPPSEVQAAQIAQAPRALDGEMTPRAVPSPRLPAESSRNGVQSRSAIPPGRARTAETMRPLSGAGLYLTPSGTSKEAGQAVRKVPSADFDTSDEDDRSSSPAPSPNVSRRSVNYAQSDAKSQQTRLQNRRSWGQAHVASGQQQPNGNPTTYPRHGASTSSSKSSRVISAASEPQPEEAAETIPARSSSLVPRSRSRAPDSPTTVSSVISSHPFSPPRSHHTAATSIDDGEVRPKTSSNGHGNGHVRDQSGSLRSRGLSVGSSSYTTAVEEPLHQGSHSKQSSLEYWTKRDQPTMSAFVNNHKAEGFAEPTTHSRRQQQQQAQKRKGKEEALSFEESHAGFGDMGNDLPGLFSGASRPASARWTGEGGSLTPRARSTTATSQPPIDGEAIEQLNALLAARFEADMARSRRPYTGRLARALLEQSSSDYDDSDASRSGVGRDGDDDVLDKSASRERAIHLLAAMKAQGLDIVDLLNVEDKIKERERQDARIAMRLRKEMKKMERTDRSRSVSISSHHAGHTARHNGAAANGPGVPGLSDKAKGKRPASRSVKAEMRERLAY